MLNECKYDIFLELGRETDARLLKRMGSKIITRLGQHLTDPVTDAVSVELGWKVDCVVYRLIHATK